MAFMDYMPTFGQNVSQQTALPQDETLMQLDLKRKLALADALRQQQMPEGQMVSGRYVAPSFTQYLANAVDTYQGNKKEREALGQFGEYQKGKQARMAEALGQYQKDLMPRIEQAPQQPTTIMGSTGEIAPNMGMVNAPARQVPVTGNDRYAALLKLSAATNNPELMQRAIVGGLDYANKADETASERAYREKQTANDQEFQRVQMKERQGFELTQGEKNFANQMALQKSSQGFQAGQNALSRQNTLKNEPLVTVVGKDGIPVYVPRNQAIGQSPYNPNQVKLTEDQAKASGWLSQATNAYNNMQNVMYKTDPATGAPLLDANGKPQLNYSNIKPSTGEMLASSLGMPGAAQTAPRQKFVQAGSSMSEALLRAATGAGVNKEEAAQKVKELTPQYFDKDEVIQQKLDAIPVYLESLKVRSSGGRNLTATPTSNIPATNTKVINGVTYVNDGKGWVKQ